MYSFSYTITDPSGIHARPAGLLVKEAGKYESKITIIKGEKKVDARRLISIMGMGIKCGDTIAFEIEGSDEAIAGAQMEAFMQSQG